MLFFLKLRAFTMIGKHKRLVRICDVCSSLGRLCGLFSCMIACMSIHVDTRTALHTLPLIGKLWDPQWGFLPAGLFFLLGTAYSVCAQSFAFALNTILADSGDARSVSLSELLNIRDGIRFLLLRFKLVFNTLKTWLFCFFPSAVTVLILYYLLHIGISPVLFSFGVGLLFLQVLSGTAAATVLKQRFSAAPYLLCTNPMLPVSDALISSALLTEHKLLRIAIIKITTLPLRFSANPVISLPYAHVYRTALDTAIGERIYGEQKTKKDNAGIVFYINKASVMVSKTNPSE